MFQPRWAFQHSLILSRSRQGVYTPKIPPLPEPALGKMLITLNNSYFYLADFSMILSRSQDGVYTPKFVYNIHLPCHDHDRGCIPPKFLYYLSLPLGKCLLRSIIPTFIWLTFQWFCHDHKMGYIPQNSSTAFTYPVTITTGGVYPQNSSITWACPWENAYYPQYFLFWFGWLFTDSVTITWSWQGKWML